MLRHMLTWYGLNRSASTYQINNTGLKISPQRCVTEATARWGADCISVAEGSIYVYYSRAKLSSGVLS